MRRRAESFLGSRRERRISSRTFDRGMQRLEKGNQGGSLRWIQILAVCRHISAALQHLPHKLIAGQTNCDGIKGRPALSTDIADRVAIMALLRLENECTLD